MKKLKDFGRKQPDRKASAFDRNREYSLVSGFFVLLFIGLMAYLAWFYARKSEDFISSPYNTRQDAFEDRVVRGDILSSDGQALAQTRVYEDGSEERVYPYGNMYAHVVGYASNGKSGLESEANFQLLSSHAFFIDQMKNEFRGRKNQGDTVVSTLDSRLQSAAYYALGDRRGAIFAMEPGTGRIRACVSKPDFDPNSIAYNWEYLVKDENDSSLLNRATHGAYPPGSTFKLVTALNQYRERGTLEGYQFQCEGQITIDDHSIHCYNYAVHGQEDLYSAFANSCNCAFAELGVQLGAKSLRRTAQSLLFNGKLPLNSYKTSTFSLSSKAATGLVMQTAIGQGDTLVSPAHMALIVSAIANGGVLMKPFLIEETRNQKGDVVKKTQTAAYQTLLSVTECNLLRKLMEQVVTQGTAYALNGRGYTAAGKTGSAEFDEEGHSHSWFVGYCNVNDPELVVAIVVENGGAGSESAVPIAAQLFDTWSAR